MSWSEDNVSRPAPEWACQEWGQYEHDWLDCPDCIREYEKWLNQERGEQS